MWTKKVTSIAKQRRRTEKTVIAITSAYSSMTRLVQAKETSESATKMKFDP
jgi:hypothetical protein